MTATRAALVAAVAMVAAAGPAAAASRSFCGGALVAEAFYRITVSAESPARAEYRGQFRAPDAGGRILTATLRPLPHVHGWRVLRPAAPFELRGDARRDVVLLSLRPGGAGAPNAQTVGGLIEFDCAYRPAD